MKRYLLDKNNISKVIIAVIALTSVLSIAIMCFIVRELTIRHDEKLIRVITSDIAEDIGNELLKAVIISSGMANDTFLHRMLKTENNYSIEECTEIMTDWLDAIKSRLNYSSAFLVSEQSGNYWQANGLIKKIDLENDPHDKWYKDVRNGGANYVLNVDTNEADQMTLSVFVNNSIIDSNGNFLGVCGVGIDMINLQKIIALDENTYKVKINLVNRDGVVVIDTEADNIENLKFDAVELKRQTEQILINKIDGTYVATKYIPEFDWYLVVQQHGDNMQSEFSNVILYMSIGFAIALAALLFFVQYLFNRSKRGAV